jgi:hypothetical protein
MVSMIKWINEMGGLWSFVQAIGVPLAVFTAIYLPSVKEKTRQLDDLICFRNIAYLSSRLIRTREPSSTLPFDRIAASTCTRTIVAIPLDRIYPSHLVGQFVELQHMMERYCAYAAGTSMDADVWEETRSRTKQAQHLIDKYLKDHGCRLNDEDLMER